MCSLRRAELWVILRKTTFSRWSMNFCKKSNWRWVWTPWKIISWREKRMNKRTLTCAPLFPRDSLNVVLRYGSNKLLRHLNYLWYWNIDSGYKSQKLVTRLHWCLFEYTTYRGVQWIAWRVPKLPKQKTHIFLITLPENQIRNTSPALELTNFGNVHKLQLHLPCFQ